MGRGSDTASREYLTDPASGLFGMSLTWKRMHTRPVSGRVATAGFRWRAPVLAILDQQDRGPGFRGPDPAESLRTKLDAIESAVVRQLNAVIKLQDESGLWHTVIDRPDSYLEASSAAGFASALGWAIFFRYRWIGSRARTRRLTSARSMRFVRRSMPTESSPAFHSRLLPAISTFTIRSKSERLRTLPEYVWGSQ